MDIITTYWENPSSPTVFRNCIRLTSVTASVLQTDFKPYMTRLAPCLLRGLKQDMQDENMVAVSERLGPTKAHTPRFKGQAS